MSSAVRATGSKNRLRNVQEIMNNKQVRLRTNGILHPTQDHRFYTKRIRANKQVTKRVEPVYCTLNRRPSVHATHLTPMRGKKTKGKENKHIHDESETRLGSIFSTSVSVSLGPSSCQHISRSRVETRNRQTPATRTRLPKTDNTGLGIRKIQLKRLKKKYRRRASWNQNNSPRIS
jgi:hypothetical protein